MFLSLMMSVVVESYKRDAFWICTSPLSRAKERTVEHEFINDAVTGKPASNSFVPAPIGWMLPDIDIGLCCRIFSQVRPVIQSTSDLYALSKSSPMYNPHTISCGLRARVLVLRR